MRTPLAAQLRKLSSITIILALIVSLFPLSAHAVSGGTFTATQTPGTAGGSDNTQSVSHTTTQTNKSETSAAALINTNILITSKTTGTAGNDISVNIFGAITDPEQMPGSRREPTSVSEILIQKNDNRISAEINNSVNAYVTRAELVEALNMTASGSLRGGLINVMVSNNVTPYITVSGGDSQTATSEQITLSGGTASQVQIETATVSGAVETGDIFSLAINDESSSFIFTKTATSTDTAATIAASLNTDINTSAGSDLRKYTSTVVGNVITITAKNAGSGFTVVDRSSNYAGTPQIIIFTPANPLAGETFRATINGVNYDTVVASGDTVKDIVENIQAATTTASNMRCSEDDVTLTCTIATSSVTYSAQVIAAGSTPDTTAPVLVLQGSSVVTVAQNDLYLDAGATATDDVDGDITARIVTTTGGFNAAILGEYTITYTVSDTAGNAATSVTRTVKVVDETAPIVTEVTAIGTTTDNTPDYTFSTTEAGTIIYGGACSSTTTSAVAGSNTITFAALSAGTYNNCTISVKDTAGNLDKNVLEVSTFTINAVTSGSGGGGGGGGFRSSSRSSTTKTTSNDDELICKGPSEAGTWYKKCSLNANPTTFSDFAANAACEGFISIKNTDEEYEMTKTAPRKEVVAVAVSMLKQDGKAVEMTARDDYKNHFTDIGVDGQATWIQSVVETALAHGIISDARDTFQPENAVTRAEAYAMIMGAVCMKPVATEATWQENVFTTAQTNGLTTRTWITFESESAILRQDLFVIAARAADWAEKTGGCNPKPAECIAE